MRAIYEFRVGEEDARRHLEPGEGKRLGTSVRKVVVDSRDELFERVKRLQHQFREKGTFFFLGWGLRHEYTRAELAAAELFHLKTRAAFEPAGESCGTEYDEAAGCRHCGVGARQLNELHLEPGSLPRGKDVAWTIACSEVVFSSRLVELLTRHGITGARFLPVRAKGSGAILPGWHQLEVTSRPLEVVEPTCFGLTPSTWMRRASTAAHRGTWLGSTCCPRCGSSATAMTARMSAPRGSIAACAAATAASSALPPCSSFPPACGTSWGR
jgi:hypothetical protein